MKDLLTNVGSGGGAAAAAPATGGGGAAAAAEEAPKEEAKEEGEKAFHTATEEFMLINLRSQRKKSQTRIWVSDCSTREDLWSAFPFSSCNHRRIPCFRIKITAL